jgi:Holliday junction resolvase RusA-like endonuclease
MEQRKREFFIEGIPVPLSRPKFANRHCYDVQKHAKLGIGILLLQQLKDEPMFKGILDVEFLFTFPIAKSNIKKKLDGKPHITKPDLDNCIKMYLDCASRVLFLDDCIVSSIKARKIYGKPGTFMIITEL